MWCKIYELLMRYLSIIVCCFLLIGCAKRGSITGGLKDTIPPVLIQSIPKNFSTDFKGNEIKLVFDELIKIKDVNKQLIVSPPMKDAPQILPTGVSKFITIKIKDTLQPNTTYSFNFGQSIQDNNEGNPYQQFKYIFSTGSYIDSLAVLGTIKDAYSKKTDNFVSVMLYEYDENFDDSIVYKENPRYITNTLDSIKAFSLENLKAGKYLLVAMKDVNNNNKFDPKTDKIGFFNEPIIVPENAIYSLELFKEELPFKPTRASQASGNKIYLGYEGKSKDIELKLKNDSTELPIKVTPLAGKDSLQIWYPKQKADSLKLWIKTDKLEKKLNVKLKDMYADSLSVSIVQSGILHFRDTLALRSSTPLSTFDYTKVTLISKDSVAVKYEPFYDEKNQQLNFIFKKEALETYHLSALPGAFTDMFEKTNDSLQFRLSTRNVSEYGNLRLNLNGVKSYPIIVELTDDSGKILATKYVTEAKTIDFEQLQPALFTVRVIYDTNKNGVWDTGSYLEKRQTEEVIYIKNPVDVRANWDVVETINLGG